MNKQKRMKQYKNKQRCTISNKLIEHKEVVLTAYALDYVKKQGYEVVRIGRRYILLILLMLMLMTTAKAQIFPNDNYLTINPTINNTDSGGGCDNCTDNATVISLISQYAWRLDASNDPPTANWNMGDFNFTNIGTADFGQDTLTHARRTITTNNQGFIINTVNGVLNVTGSTGAPTPLTELFLGAGIIAYSPIFDGVIVFPKLLSTNGTFVGTSLTINGNEVCQDDGTNCPGGDGTGGWTNTSTETNTSLDVNANSNLTVGDTLKFSSTEKIDSTTNSLQITSADTNTGTAFYSGSNPMFTIHRLSSGVPTRSVLDAPVSYYLDVAGVPYMHGVGGIAYIDAQAIFQGGYAKFPDSSEMRWGTASDSSISWNTTDLLLNANRLGTGKLYISGDTVMQNSLSFSNLPQGDQSNSVGYVCINATGGLFRNETGC